MAETINVVCPNCSNEMRASVKHIGRRGRCPECGHLVPIIAPDEGRSAVSLANVDDEADARTAGGTDVNPFLAGIIGLAAAALLYGLFYSLPKDSYFYLFMTQRSIIQHLIVLVTCWGLAILALKYFAVKREMRSTELELELIPLEIGMQITPANVDKFVGHLGQLPRTEQGSFLARRIRGVLEHFKHRNNVSEVQSYLATQADIEASAVDSGYTLLRVFIWVCPILGFIGTVLGIGWAVTDLAKALPEAPSATAPAPATAPPAGGAPAQAGLGDKLLDGMRLVTDGLATAFDTTLLGLVCVVILMFPTEALKKIEYGMLDRVQGFSNESLLRRMAEGQATDKDAMPEVVQRALDTAFKEHQRWLTQWQAQVAKLGSVIGAEFEAHFSNLQEKLVKVEAGRVGDFNTAVRRVEELFGQVEQMTASWQKLGSGDFKTAISAVAQLHQALAANTGALERVLGQQGALLDKYSASDLNGVLRSLSEAVTQLSEQRSAAAANHQPLTPRHAARRSGIFSRILGRDRE